MNKVLFSDEDPARERELCGGPLKGFLGDVHAVLLDLDHDEGLAPVYACGCARRLAIGALHTLLEPVGLGDIHPLMLAEDDVGERYDLHQVVIRAQLELQEPVSGDARRLEAVIPNLS